MKGVRNVSRREFLAGAFSASALVLCTSLMPEALLASDVAQQTTGGGRLQPNVFVAVESDGTVYIVAARSEMGTGIRTSLPLVLADELDADWRRVKIRQAIGDSRYGSQDTDGSHSVRSFFDAMRECGAAARMMLVEAAARHWDVPVDQCEATVHVVRHRPTGRTLGYGQLAANASKLPVPPQADLKLKARSAWRYIGKPIASYDLVSLCSGKPVFGMDVRVDGKVYASVERPPVFGGKVKSYDDAGAMRVRGVKQTVLIPPFKPPCAFQALGGVAVVADNTWAAMQGRKKLKVNWDDGPNATFDSIKYKEELRNTSRKAGQAHS
jgi:isoquinoline 1-oxidoreductase subunit beta